MPLFELEGVKESSRWLADGSPIFGYLAIDPSNSESDQLPIFLKKGNFSFGSVHIEKKHHHWVRTTKMSVPELVYAKLRQRGRIFTKESNNKNKLSMRISPEALIVLELAAIGSMPHWSVTTIYKHPSALDGQEIGKYYPAKSIGSFIFYQKQLFINVFGRQA